MSWTSTCVLWGPDAADSQSLSGRSMLSFREAFSSSLFTITTHYWLLTTYYSSHYSILPANSLLANITTTFSKKPPECLVIAQVSPADLYFRPHVPITLFYINFIFVQPPIVFLQYTSMFTPFNKFFSHIFYSKISLMGLEDLLKNFYWRN